MDSHQPPDGSAPQAYRITAEAVHEGAAVLHAAGTDIPLAAAWGGPPTEDPGPADLLAGAFAACLLKNLARAAALTGFSYTSAHVQVDARRQDRPPTFVAIDYVLTVGTDEPERRLELVHRNLAKFGTVYNTLAAVCEIDGRIEAHAP
ncbi:MULTISPECIES: OsmC family protein [unclassified Ornithinimicrobium]|uniref:OsmC family protein n=1 Tax=unclassified Ornithinimicrobium TaxID=2615080 RepID=UPI003854ACCE